MLLSCQHNSFLYYVCDLMYYGENFIQLNKHFKVTINEEGNLNKLIFKDFYTIKTIFYKLYSKSWSNMNN